MIINPHYGAAYLFIELVMIKHNSTLIYAARFVLTKPVLNGKLVVTLNLDYMTPVNREKMLTQVLAGNVGNRIYLMQIFKLHEFGITSLSCTYYLYLYFT